MAKEYSSGLGDLATGASDEQLARFGAAIKATNESLDAVDVSILKADEAAAALKDVMAVIQEAVELVLGIIDHVSAKPDAVAAPEPLEQPAEPEGAGDAD